MDGFSTSRVSALSWGVFDGTKPPNIIYIMSCVCVYLKSKVRPMFDSETIKGKTIEKNPSVLNCLEFFWYVFPPRFLFNFEIPPQRAWTRRAMSSQN